MTTDEEQQRSGLVASAGVVTAGSLVLFGAAAIRVPLTTLGLLQYLTPVLQLALGVAYFHEAMPPERWAGFALVWVALAVLTWDALRTARRTRARAAEPRAVAARAATPPGGAPATGDGRFPGDGPVMGHASSGAVGLGRLGRCSAGRPVRGRGHPAGRPEPRRLTRTSASAPARPSARAPDAYAPDTATPGG